MYWKNLKYKIIILLLLNILCAKVVLATSTISSCAPEQFYLHKQTVTKLNKDCPLQSSFYFNSIVEQNKTLTPLTNKYKTKLHIPRSNVN